MSSFLRTRIQTGRMSQHVLQRTAAKLYVFKPCSSESYNKCYNMNLPASRERVLIDQHFTSNQFPQTGLTPSSVSVFLRKPALRTMVYYKLKEYRDVKVRMTNYWRDEERKRRDVGETCMDLRQSKDECDILENKRERCESNACCVRVRRQQWSR